MVSDGILTTEKDQRWIQTMIDKIVKPRGYSDIKANLEGYEPPARLSRREEEDEAYVPDATAVSYGRKMYFELAVKTDREREVVSKWKLMSRLASAKAGKFFLIAPRGHVAFAQRLVKLYDISAEVIRI
ncbi:MAG TPA: hypothetical protein PKC76_06300 [Saprospiraceae bacterium]|nr:hypothetical protein [Saprospiraceae bacterium]